MGGVFFFQAEDGIRYLTVTGVQTCALPICLAPSALCDDAGPGCLAGVLRSSSARSRSINGTERSERRRAAIRALQQAVERFADATATKRFPSSRCASAIRLFARWNPPLRHSLNSSQLCCTVIRAVYDDAGNAIETHEHT